MMKKFVAVFIGTQEGFERSGWNALTEEERQARQREGIAAWNRWLDENRAAVVDVGSPLGKTKKASPRGIEDTRNALTAYTVVQAGSHEAAARLFANHPHFTIFPGDSIEIMECLPIPRA